jgi:glycosyltransferase involved in cell wall biosynthesis
MRILYLTNGQTPHDLRFTTALAQTQHEVFAIPLDGVDYSWPAGIKTTNWKPVRKSWRGLRLNTPKLNKVIKDISPDLVHAGPVQGPAFLASLTGVHPLVTMSWGSDLLFEAQRNFQTRIITRSTLMRTDILVGDSQCIEVEARRFGFRGPYFQFPWGVDLEHFSPAGTADLRERLNWKNHTVLLSMRAFEKIYDVECILKGFLKAVKEKPELRLIILGRGSQEERLKRIAIQSGESDKIYFGGTVALEDLPDIYRSTDLYVSASHSDGASVSLMEALACGLPVLVSDIPGNGEWVTPGDNGWLFDKGNSPLLSQYMTEFEKESETTRQMKNSNRILAEERADWKRNFPVLLKAYEKAFEIHRGQG